MPSQQRTFSVFVTNDVTLTLATEVVVATLGGISTPTPDAVVRLLAWASITGAVSATVVTLRIRRQSLTGTQVGESVVPNIGGNVIVEVQIEAEDSPGDVAGLPYVLTANAGGAAMTATTAELVAIVG